LLFQRNISSSENAARFLSASMRTVFLLAATRFQISDRGAKFTDACDWWLFPLMARQIEVSYFRHFTTSTFTSLWFFLIHKRKKAR